MSCRHAAAGDSRSWSELQLDAATGTSMTRPHIEPYVELDQGYKPFTLPGFPGGSRYKVLSMNRETGACSLKMEFAAGYRRPPGLSYSDQELFVLRGSVRIGAHELGAGHYLFIPAGFALEGMRSPGGFEALVFYNDGLPTHVESDVHHERALTAAFVSVNGYENGPWIMEARYRPGVASGCMVKPLRVDPLTRATTFIYSMAPRFWQDNISYHDCAEESYHIWGTSWMLQFGEIPTGGYFWRPAYVNHGAFASHNGCIALGRTDSELHNYFHYNPWSTPEDNRLRAAAHLYARRPQLFEWTRVEGHNHPEGPPDFELPDYQAQLKRPG